MSVLSVCVNLISSQANNEGRKSPRKIMGFLEYSDKTISLKHIMQQNLKTERT
jgi:hypothetical protein